MSGLLDSSLTGLGTSFSAPSGAASTGFQHTGTSQGLHNIHGSFSVPNMADTLTSRITTMTHISSHVHSGVTSRLGMNVVGTPEYSSSTSGLGGSLPGILLTSTAIGNRSAGNASPWITSAVGNMVGGNVGRSMSSGGGLSVHGLASRLNLIANTGSENLRLQSPSRLSGILQQGGNDYVTDLQQEEQFHDNAMSMMGRSSGFNLGGILTSHRPQQQQQRHPPSVSSNGISFSGVNQDHLHVSDMFQSAHSGYRPQTSSPSGIGLRPLNSPNIDSGMVSHDQLIQQYQQHSNRNQFRLQQISSQNQSYKDQGVKSMQAAPDPFCLLGLLSVIRMTDPHLTSLALGIDLTTLGLSLNSTENLHKTFGSPWSDEPAKGDPEVTVPQCYYAKETPPLHQSYFLKFPMDTLFYIFHSMPKDEAQIYAANELYNRGWFYHRELHLWLTRVSNMEPLVKTNAYERGSYICFDPNTWEMLRKDNFVIYNDMLERRKALPQQ